MKKNSRLKTNVNVVLKKYLPPRKRIKATDSIPFFYLKNESDKL